MLARAPGDVTHANVAQVKRSPPPGRSPKEAAFPATPGANACDGPAIVKVEGINPDHSRGPSREESRSQSAVVALGLGVPVVGTAVDGLARTLAAAAASSSRPRHRDRKSTRLNSSHDQISYAVFCLKKKNTTRDRLAIKESIKPLHHPTL